MNKSAGGGSRRDGCAHGPDLGAVTGVWGAGKSRADAYVPFGAEWATVTGVWGAGKSREALKEGEKVPKQGE